MEKPNIFFTYFYVRHFYFSSSVFHVFWLEHKETFFLANCFEFFFRIPNVLVCPFMQAYAYQCLSIIHLNVYSSVFFVHFTLSTDEYRHLFHNNLIYGQFGFFIES